MTIVAGPHADAQHALLVKRRVPCICRRQHEPEPPTGVAVRMSTSREMTVERVACSSCPMPWVRINAR